MSPGGSGKSPYCYERCHVIFGYILIRLIHLNMNGLWKEEAPYA